MLPQQGLERTQKTKSPSVSGVSEALGLNDMALEREEREGHSPGEH